jgi:AmiR/NasT family two-component response regulator
VFTLALPVKGGELAGAVNTLVQLVAKKEALLTTPTQHDDELTIVRAVDRLIRKTHITEDEAREYIRRKSMETSTRMAAVAAVILKTLG